MGTIGKLFLSITMLSISLEAIEWFSFEKAKQEQKKTHKIIMLDVMRDSCHYCKDMDKNVFDNQEMIQWLEERFIPAQVNLDFSEMPIDEQIIITPTFFFINEEGKVIKKIPGSWNIQDFKDLTKGIK